MKILIFFFILLSSVMAKASSCTEKLVIDGAIGPATLDFVERGVASAKRNSCPSIILLINTPGGSLETTRRIVENILNSEIPFLCLVHPEGGHAGSAGAIILQACHVAGAMATTNIGAATPVSLEGQIPEDMKKKLYNDTTSWMDALTELRKRNKEFGRDIVTKAKAVDAKEALNLGAIDTVSDSIESFLSFSKNRKVKMKESKEIKVETGALLSFEQDLRFHFLALVTHPQVTYLIFMGSLGLLYFELTHPGMVAPGVVGAVGLVISLISFHMLNVQWGGLALLLLGVAFMIAELFVTSFGALGIGGLAAFVAGSLLLFDSSSGVVLPLATILPTAVGLGGLMLGLGYLALKTRDVRRKSGSDVLLSSEAKVVELVSAKQGRAEVNGEVWNFTSIDDLKLNDLCTVKSVDGLTLKLVRKF